MRRGRSAAAPGPVQVSLRIDELVLHGVAPGDRHLVAEALERELASLIEREGVPAGLHQRADEAPVVPAIVLPRGAGPEALGRGAAGALYRVLAAAPADPAPAPALAPHPERGS